MKPVLLHYFITTRCNARCVFCDIWKKPAGPDAMADQVAVNLVAARNAGCRFVDFTGGEPLLHDDLPELLRHARRTGYITSVTTNCLLFPDRASELAGLIDLLHFSIDADTPELHDAIRGRVSYQSVVTSIDCALKNDMVPDLLFTYTEKNIDAFEGIYRLARQKRLIVILDPVFDITGKDPLDPAVHLKAEALSRRPGVYLNRAHLTLRSQGGNQTLSPLCRAVDSTIVILPDNTLALPCFHHRIDQVPLTNGLEAVLSGPVCAEAVKMQGQYQFCENCHINCYFDPSYGYMRNRMFLHSMAAKMKYAWYKYVRYHRPVPRRLL
ncbi:MAG: radical SAM protein [Chitinispirillaceae bacterium]|nr:radical SAM protein [Chitinispirillaceae bacterium]